MIRRHKKVETSYSGQFISQDSNYTVKCPEGTKARDPFVEANKNMSDRSLKLMALMSGNGYFFFNLVKVISIYLVLKTLQKMI